MASTSLSSVSMLILFSSYIGRRKDNSCGLLFTTTVQIFFYCVNSVIILINFYCCWLGLRKLSKKQKKVWGYLIKISLYTSLSQNARICVYNFCDPSFGIYFDAIIDLLYGVVVFFFGLFGSNIWKFLVKKYLKYSRSKKIEKKRSEMTSILLLEGEVFSEVEFLGDLFRDLTKKVKLT